jgi:hypothetical protein
MSNIFVKLSNIATTAPKNPPLIYIEAIVYKSVLPIPASKKTIPKINDIRAKIFRLLGLIVSVLSINEKRGK